MANDMTIDELAQLIKGEFDRVDQRFEKIDQRFEKIDQRFDKVDERLEAIELKMTNVAYRFEVDDLGNQLNSLTRRVEVIENK